MKNGFLGEEEKKMSQVSHKASKVTMLPMLINPIVYE